MICIALRGYLRYNAPHLGKMTDDSRGIQMEEENTGCNRLLVMPMVLGVVISMLVVATVVTTVVIAAINTPA